MAVSTSRIQVAKLLLLAKADPDKADKVDDLVCNICNTITLWAYGNARTCWEACMLINNACANSFLRLHCTNRPG